MRVRIGALAGVVTLASAGFAAAEARFLTFFCADNGAYCYGVAKRSDGRIDFRLGTKSFTGRYNLCVTDPAKLRVCHRYKPGRHTGLSIVDWKQNFPDKRKGQYRVQWRRAGSKLGPDAYFNSRQFGNRRSSVR